MKHIPEHIANGNDWEKNVDNIESHTNPLFYTVDGTQIFHGDTYWAYTNDEKTAFNMVIANERFDYNDGVERFKTKEQSKRAWEVFTWLNVD